MKLPRLVDPDIFVHFGDCYDLSSLSVYEGRRPDPPTEETCEEEVE